MSKQWRVALGLLALAVLVLPTSALAGDAYIKGGVVLGGNNGAFTNRWFISTGTDWGVSDSAYLGLEFQGAFRSNNTVGNAVVDSVPANLFLNGKWKSNTDDVRPYAGLGFRALRTAYAQDPEGMRERVAFANERVARVLAEWTRPEQCGTPCGVCTDTCAKHDLQELLEVDFGAVQAAFLDDYGRALREIGLPAADVTRWLSQLAA